MNEPLYEIVNENDPEDDGYEYSYQLVENEDPAEIALCTLSAINWGKIKNPEDFAKPCELAVRGLDALLDLQNYPVLAAEISTKNRRPIGVGIINLAYWMAKNDLSYQDIDQVGLDKIHTFTESWAYYLTQASIQLAEEKGSCPKSSDTLYHQGIFPIDTAKKHSAFETNEKYQCDWDLLKSRAKEFGIRNSTIMAIMPSETSSQISNATNGIEPARSYVSIKQSKDGILKQVVPEIRKLKNKYDLLWDQKSPEGYLKICAIIQKFVDQAMSVNTSYNPKMYEDEQIPMSEMLKHLILTYQLGIKTLYYHNTADGAGEIDTKLIPLEPSKIEEENCDGCVI